MLTLLEVAIGTYCFMVPWAMSNGINGRYECLPERSGTVQMMVGKLSDARARVEFGGAQWASQICDGWCPSKTEEE
jgi:hypothetical protein